jgi:hypothetical protein
MTNERRPRRVHGAPRDRGSEEEADESSEDHAEPRRLPPSPLEDSPERAVVWTYVLGGVIGATSLGVIAISVDETGAARVGDTAQQLLWGGILVATAVQAVVWALLLRAAMSLRAPWAGVLLFVAGLAPSALEIAGILHFELHPPRPSLFPWAGAAFAIFLSPILLLSFAPVFALARRVRTGATTEDARDVVAAGLAWAAAVAALSLALAPGLGFMAISTAAVVVAVIRLERALSRVRPLDDDASRARPPSRGPLFRTLRRGGSSVALLSLVLVPLRVYERIGASNPAINVIYERGLAPYERVRPAGREGDISLWVIDHGTYCGAPIGWDERDHLLLRDEQLIQRVPRLRSVPQISTAQPR